MIKQADSNTPAPSPRRVIRPNRAAERVGLSLSTVWRLVRAGDFPAPIRLSARAVGWTEVSIETWLASRQEA
jgi:prophage regulatory protein